MSILIDFVISIVLTIVFVYIGVSELNKDAKAKAFQTGKVERGYTVWSVLLGGLILMIVIFCSLLFGGKKYLGF